MLLRVLAIALCVTACKSVPATKPSPLAGKISELAATAGFSGTILVGRGAELRYLGSSGPRANQRTPSDRWRWASVTKQLTAVLVMQEVARGTIDLATPISTYLPDFASPNAKLVTVEQLLRHQSDFPNPEEVPAFYQPTSAVDPLAFCAGEVTGPPGDKWTYNNCDYVVAGAILEAVTKRTWSQLFEERIAKPTQTSASLSAQSDVIGWDGAAREPAYAYERFGAAGALVGTITDLWKIDRALLDGTLLDERGRQQMWNGRPDLGFMALGQWVYDVPLKGCATPVRLVERRGAIGGIGVRNFLLPATGTVVIAMSDQATLEFGELWSGTGFSFELLSVAACSDH